MNLALALIINKHSNIRTQLPNTIYIIFITLLTKITRT